MSPLLAKLGYYIAIVVGLIGSLFIGSMVGSEDYQMVIFIGVAIVGVVWVVASGENWWLPMPFAVGLGGVFYVPFKIFPHELALAICGLALLPRLPFKLAGLRKRRPSLPLPVYLLAAYLIVHATVCLFIYRDGGGTGNIARAYMNSLWGIIFGIAFYLFGATKSLRTGFGLFYAAVVIRCVLGLVNAWQGDVLFIPGINYALDPQDIRNSGNLLMIIAGLACLVSTNPFGRAVNGMIAGAAGIAWLALGGSRGQLLQTMLFMGTMALIFRWRGFLVVMGTAVGLAAVVLNVTPNVIEPLPYQTQRALTAFMWSAPVETEVQNDVKGSGRFREVISEEGRKRWLESTRTFVIGTGIRPFDEAYFASSSRFEVEEFTLLVQNAADVGAYETGLWTMLAVTGLAGLVLFFWACISLLRGLLRGLRELPTDGFGRAFAAWGAAALVSFLLLCVLAGGFPSFEIFLAMIGLAYLQDLRAWHRVVSTKSVPQVESRSFALPMPEPVGARA